MKRLILYRLGAILVDYLVILAYAGILFLAASQFNTSGLGPVSGQITGFLGMTVPVFLYFFLTERSNAGATFGKRVFNLKVVSLRGRNRIFIRNLFKFLPWEIAHTGVHWVVFYSRQGTETPAWVFVLLVLPQLIGILYSISILMSKGTRSTYDRLAGTEVLCTT